MCQRAHILTLSFHAGESWGSILEKVSFHVSLSATLNIFVCPMFFTRLPLPCSFLHFLSQSLPFDSSFLMATTEKMPWTFLKVDGRIKWKAPFKTSSMRFLNWRTWSFTSAQVWKACLYMQSHCCAHLSTAKGTWLQRTCQEQSGCRNLSCLC